MMIRIHLSTAVPLFTTLYRKKAGLKRGQKFHCMMGSILFSPRNFIRKMTVATFVVFIIITKTRIYTSFDPLKPLSYIVKLGFTGVYIIVLILIKKKTNNKNIGCGYLLEPPRRGGSNEYLQSMF